MQWEHPYIVLGIPITLNIRVELLKQLGASLRPRSPETTLIEEEVDSKVGLSDVRLIDDGESSDA